MQSSQLKEERDDTVAELAFGILSEDVNSEVNADINLSSLSNISDTSGTGVDVTHVNSEKNSEVNTDVNLSSLSNISETSVTVDGSQPNEAGNDVTDGISAEVVADALNSGTSLIQPNLLPENLVLVETSKGLVGYVSAGVDEQGRQLISPSMPVALFNNIHSGGIVEGQDGGLFGSSPDGITVNAAQLFDENSPHLQTTTGMSVPVQLIPADLGSQVSSSEKRKKGGGWPKGKKRKAVPEVQAPKKPATGYVLYAVKRRQQIKVTDPKLTFSEVTKLLGQEWTNLPEETKNKYLELAEKDKKRYIGEMKQFQHSEHYQNYLRRRKSETGEQEVDSLIDLEGVDGEDELQCKICNQFFISVHNKKEHMFGRQHITAITKQIQAQADLQKQQAMTAASLDTQAMTTIINGNTTPPPPQQKPQDDKPVDIEGFIQEFLKKNQEREAEIDQLLKSRKSYQEENEAMDKQIKELQELESKLDQDIGSLKAYGSSLTAQIDSLKMVPTLFGVINF